jgi:hypothetical protein
LRINCWYEIFAENFEGDHLGFAIWILELRYIHNEALETTAAMHDWGHFKEICHFVEFGKRKII